MRLGGHLLLGEQGGDEFLDLQQAALGDVVIVHQVANLVEIQVLLGAGRVDLGFQPDELLFELEDFALGLGLRATNSTLYLAS